MRKPLFLLLWLLFACHLSNAQVSRGGKPYSYSANLAEQIITQTIPSLSQANLRKEDEQREKQGLPLRVGIIFPTDYSLNNTGTWSTLPNGDRVWRLKIDVQGALATSLYYNNFHLPEGALLFVYNEDHSQLIGSYTSANNQQGGLFATEILKGNACTIEYYEPGSVRGKGHFTISGVNNIYSERIPEARNNQQKDFGDAGSCNVNVNCPEGANWQNQKRAVARILLRLGGAAYLCTGALVNNARSDCKPYFLTANHCGSNASASDFNQWIFYFNYEAPSCANPANEPVSNTITGCVQRARSGDSGEADGSDFQLLQFNSSVPASYNVYYAGWNANDVASPSGVTIHHPAGDIKKISTYTTPLTNDNFNTTGPPYTHWKAVWAQTQTNWSVTEGGSSGSPLFNSTGQIVGQLSGGPSSCTASTANKNDEYGKMSYNWTSNGTDVLHQLKPWLDPDNTGILSLAGTNYPCGDTTNVSCPDMYEPNNTLATAYTIVTNTDIRGTINTPSDTDYFKVVLTDSSYLGAFLDNLGANFDIRLLSSAGSQLAISQNAGTTPDSLFSIVGPGTYYFQVYGYNGAVYDSICYRLYTNASIIGGCTDQLESNNTLATAATIFTGTTLPALIASASDLDYYRITTTGTNTITVNLSNLPADYDVRLLSSTGSQLAISQNGGTSAETITYNNAAAGTYYIYVYGYSGAFSASKCYHLLVNATPSVACTNTFEPNGTRATAAAISVNTEINSQIASSTDVDWFKFSNTSAQPHIEVLLSNLPGDYDLYLYDSTGSLLGSSENGSTSSERIVYNNGPVGTYYIRVVGYNGASSTSICYKLTANISSTPKTAEISKNRKTIDRALNVYPVPSTGKVYTELNSSSNKLQYITVTDMTGKVVFTKQYRVVSGYNRLEIILPSSLHNGIYIVSDGTNSRKVVLQR
ncbi:pre-peptidase C-terminal domain-containing protein [Chitinophaga filiformis]|uniref:Por secretion system C-terminal sorting domain-containing protein n=1 Tax=Chitinophaga filiformis TaxID=104663 RepID=A0A1G7NS91_CHIFI|nr:pre-peptidase C-terminal domain-containing protein [Chitinophaga filiformis]SDF76945.1 Por secretion system C-terminal sorting domain-containing protein [Chitinophaga filiformis]